MNQNLIPHNPITLTRSGIMMLMAMPSSSSLLAPQHRKPTLSQLLPVFTLVNPTTADTCAIDYFSTVGIATATTRRIRRIGRWAVSPSSSDNQTVVTARTTGEDGSPTPSFSYTASSEVVRNFYGGINRRDLASVQDLIAHNCVYEDLIFPRPFLGRKAILEFFQKFIDSISVDLQFVIDDISDEDSSAVGVSWHLEWTGKPFPFGKGCSFYRLDVANGKRQIVYGRDCVEPAIKPGEMALVAIKGVTWLLQQFPQLVNQL